MSNELLEAALAYAARGWFVIPNYSVNTAANGSPCSCGKGVACTSPGKHPRIEGWEGEATTDPEKIKAWWDWKPLSNVGVSTGPSRLIVVDVDGEEGAINLMKLIEGKDWPDTVRFVSGSGKGTHYLFTAPAGVDVRNKQEWKAYPGVDIRAGGGQIVVPPSLHKSGNRYRALDGPAVPAPVPTWLAVLLAQELARKEKGPADDAPPPAEGPATPSPRAQSALRKYEKWQEVFDVANASRTNALGGAALDLFGFVKSGELRYEAAIDALRALGEAWGWFVRYGEDEFQRQVMINAWGNARAKEPSDHPAHLAWEQGPQESGDTPVEGGGAPPEKPKKTCATLLLELVDEAGIELWHTQEGKAYATVGIKSHREHYPVVSKLMKLWLQRLFFQAIGGIPSSQAVLDVLGILEGKALFDGPEYPVYIRLAEKDGKIYLDLANAEWSVVEVDGWGWRVIDAAPVRFRRPDGMLPLPIPEGGGDLAALRPFINTPAKEGEEGHPDAQWIMSVAWLLNALNPWGPYSILVVQGEHGSAKSTTAGVLRGAIDPNAVPLRALPKEIRDLQISAGASWALNYDNLSGLPDWLSDAFCRLATDGGFSVRKHYEDDQEQLFRAKRPVILNGIDDVATRADLADRALVLNLPRIDPKTRRREKEMWEEFRAAHGKILGALLTAVSAGLRNLPSVHLPELPRMAELSLWMEACEEALPWPQGTFTRVYAESRRGLALAVLEGNRFAQVARQFAEKEKAWTGTTTDLLAKLNDLAEDADTSRRVWPKDATRCSNALRRAAPALRAAGVLVETGKGKDRFVEIRLETPTPKVPETASPASPASSGTDSAPLAATLRKTVHSSPASPSVAGLPREPGCDDEDPPF